MARTATIYSGPGNPPATFEEDEPSEMIVWRPSGVALLYAVAAWLGTIMGAVGIYGLTVWLIR